jgi:ABC transporter substrate binding protein
MSGKWLELVKEVAPQVERVGFIIHPETPALIRYFKSAEALASALNVKLVALSVHDAVEIERALIAFAAEGNGGLIVGPHAVTLTNRDLIVALAARLRLPAIYPVAFYAQAGGLDFVWPRSGKPVSAGGWICRPHTARHQACRPAVAVPDEASIGRQSQNRQSAGPRHSGIIRAARRRGDRITGWMSAFGTKRTSRRRWGMSAFGGVKRT